MPLNRPAQALTPGPRGVSDARRWATQVLTEIGRPELVEAPGHWRGVGFRLGQRRFVSSFEEVVEILSLPAVTPVPGAQAWMLGVANVRGSLLPVPLYVVLGAAH